jgi:hypothetical protein
MSGYHATSSHEVSAPASSLDDVSAELVLDVSVAAAVSSFGVAVVESPPSVVSGIALELPDAVFPPPAQLASARASTTFVLRRLSRRHHPTNSRVRAFSHRAQALGVRRSVAMSTTETRDGDAAVHVPARMRLWEQACGLLIAVAAVLPITPSGQSFLTLLRNELDRGLVFGLLMLVGFGSPFLFGLAVAIAGWARVRATTAVLLVRVPVACLHGQLLLVSFVLWRNEQGIATLPLFGFAVVGALGFAFADKRRPAVLELRRNLEWGASTIAGVAAWCRLQRLAGLELGIAIDVVLVAALVLALAAHTLPRIRLDDR